MALAIYPLSLSPASIVVPYTSEPIIPYGGVAPYHWTFSGDLPLGITLNDETVKNATQVVLSGKPVIPDQYSQEETSSPRILNPSTFTLSVTDSTPTTPQVASITYTIPVYKFTEAECISTMQLISAVYQIVAGSNFAQNYYMQISEMGTRTIKIGDIGDPVYGGITNAVNAYLSYFTFGQCKALREVICLWDGLKFQTQTQMNGSVGPITGLSNDPEKARQQLIGIAKSLLPCFTRAEIDARFNRGGGSDSVGSATGQGGSSSVMLSR